jgi:hypothetical protein
MSGAGTLDKVAGPVGEALIMTGLGLAVAIPRWWAYNWFTRANRVVLAKLDAVCVRAAHLRRDGPAARRRCPRRCTTCARCRSAAAQPQPGTV